MQLSNRLLAIASEVPENVSVADVGCDHAYTSIYLAKYKNLKHIIAMDVRTGPLEKAILNIRANGLEDKIETRLSDGLKAVEQNEVDAVVISGMGGALMKRILVDSFDVVKGVEHLILQPQTEIAELRRFLHEIGFRIRKEVMLVEDGKYYTIIAAVRGEEGEYKEEELEFGRYLLTHKDETLKQLLEIEYGKLERILRNLENYRESNQKRIEELEEKKRLIQIGLRYYI